MQRLSCVLAIALAACSSSKSAQTMPTAAASDAPTCAAVADHTMDLLSKGAPDAKPALVKNIRDTLVSHCETDQWSAATRACFAKLATKDDAQTCEDSLTAAQRQALDKENVGGGAEGGGGGAPAGVSAPVPSSTLSPSPPPPGTSRSPNRAATRRTAANRPFSGPRGSTAASLLNDLG
jgi:hypothetical protein